MVISNHPQSKWSSCRPRCFAGLAVIILLLVVATMPHDEYLDDQGLCNSCKESCFSECRVHYFLKKITNGLPPGVTRHNLGASPACRYQGPCPSIHHMIAIRFAFPQVPWKAVVSSHLSLRVMYKDKQHSTVALLPQKPTEQQLRKLTTPKSPKRSALWVASSVSKSLFPSTTLAFLAFCLRERPL